jgi:hypothetical protein
MGEARPDLPVALAVEGTRRQDIPDRREEVGVLTRVFGPRFPRRRSSVGRGWAAYTLDRARRYTRQIRVSRYRRRVVGLTCSLMLCVPSTQPRSVFFR